MRRWLAGKLRRMADRFDPEEKPAIGFDAQEWVRWADANAKQYVKDHIEARTLWLKIMGE